MGIYLSPSRYLKLRLTKRGIRVAVGPRWLRYHAGAGGQGMSTGHGPFSWYRPIRPRRRVPRKS